VTVAELNELLLRLVLSVFLVPGESRDSVVGVLEGTLGSMVRLAAGRDLDGSDPRQPVPKPAAARRRAGAAARR